MQIPPLEMCFKGGPQIEAGLQDHLFSLRASGAFGVLQWLSLTTSDSGSYTAEKVLAFLERHLHPWGPGRRWIIITADDYRGHQSVEIFDLCWSRGYLLLLMGGGVTGAVQIPDTHLHLPLSTQYQHAEMELLAGLMDLNPVGLPLMSREDCVRELCAIYSNPALHTKVANRGTRDNMYTLALDGSEKHLANPQLLKLWEELQMDKWVTLITADLDATHASGALEWTSDFARGLLEPCPKRCTLDRYEEFMDDEGECVEPHKRPVFWDDNAGCLSPDVSDVEGDEGTHDELEASPEEPGPAGFAGELAPAGLAAEPAPVDDAAAMMAVNINLQLSSLDSLRERAEEIGDSQIVAAVRRASCRERKRLVGTGQENPLWWLRKCFAWGSLGMTPVLPSARGIWP